MRLSAATHISKLVLCTYVLWDLDEGEGVQAQYKLGVCYATGTGIKGDSRLAVKWYLEAAKQGHVQAQYESGVCYATGAGILPSFKLAVSWYLEAANQGHAQAQYELGVRCEFGHGGRDCKESAVSWYLKAAEQGHVKSQYKLGVCYATGTGIKRDFKLAVKWYLEAAKQGHVQAQYNSGYCYENGIGIQKDDNLAKLWYSRAEDQVGYDYDYNYDYCEMMQLRWVAEVVNEQPQIPDEYRGRYFYHITHIDNLDSIIKHGLLSTNEKNHRQIHHHNIANEQIQNRRRDMEVPVGLGGAVHDYVPFYFAQRTSMFLSVIKTKAVDQYEMIIIAISIDKLLDLPAVFTDAAASTNEPPKFYSHLGNLSNLNWELIDSKDWGSNNEREKQQKMAEVLIHNQVHINDIAYFRTFDDRARQRIIEKYMKYNLNAPHIDINLYHYYSKFMIGRPKESLITGPNELQAKFEQLIENIVKMQDGSRKRFYSILHMVDEIENNFCVLPELKEIDDLITSNVLHTKTMGRHTLAVVDNIDKCNISGRTFSEPDETILKLAAYLHDIGKGPMIKWKSGKQQAYDDHPADAIPMLQRILTQEERCYKAD